MNYNENRLQFVHCDTLFNTAEEAKRYVIGNLETIQRPSLYAEPMVLKYGEASKPNIILAIGSVGDGVTQSMDNRTFFIDFAKAENDIKELIEVQGENKEMMQKLQSIIDNLIVSCGLDENGKYNKESIEDDAILANSNSLYEADKLLSEYIIALEKKHSLNVEESSSIKFELTKDDETGMLLSGSVKLAENKTVDKTVLDNQLLSEEDGLFYNVDFSYDNVNSKAIFSVNGNKTEYDLPKETFLVDGKYDSESESLILSLNREAEYNGKTVKDISIDLKDLIGEWGVLPVDAQNSPIILTKSAVTSEDVLHGATLTQDILSADVRIASNEQVPDNILKKDSTGRYLYVEGKAKNISYWDKNGNKITVDEALNNVKCNVSTHVGNIIVEKTDGLFATVSLDYDVASNTLKFNDGVNSVKSIKLNSAEFIDDVSYDSVNEVIKIRFKLADGTTNIIEIPVGDIIEEWDVDNTGTTVTLKKVRNVGRGQDMLSANVNVANSSDDNILTVKGNALYVKGTADNIRYKETTVASELDSIKNDLSNEIESRKNADDALTASLTQEVNDRITGDTEVKNLVKAEENRAISEETRIEHLVNDNAVSIAENKEKISTIETTVDSFDNRIQTVEEGFAVVKEDVEKAVEEANAMADKVQANADAIAAETSRAKLAEQNNQSAINQEVQRATAAEEAIAASVETEKERAITAESELRVSVNANTNDISQVSNKLNSEIERAIAKEQELTSADASLSEKLSTEITRATAAEEKIASDLVNEITRSQSTDEQIIAKVDINSGNIVAETNRATSKETEIERNVETLNGALTNEITRAQDAENALSTRVKTNADAITILNGSVETAGSVREIVSHVQEDVEAKINNEITRATAAENGLQSQIDNLKSDVSAGNEQTLADAKAYTDAEVAKHKVDTDNAIANAKAEAISTAAEDASNKSSQTLVDAKAYTDEQTSLVSERLNVSISNAKAEAIEAASADATTKSDAALTSAKAYTDAEVAKHKVDTDNAIANAKREAIEMAVENSVQSSKEYTDTQISTLSTSVNTSISDAKREAIEAASADATTKSDAALTSAKAYTDTHVALSAERLGRDISDAKREAIEAASADATTKSDAALTSAKAYTDAETVRATAAENGLQSQIDNLISKDSELVVELAKKIENVEVRKNSESDLQYTLYVDGVPAGDINIPQDQFLQDVTYNSVSKELTFLFITSEGVKTQVVNVSDLIDVYVAGNGLSLVDNTFSVKRDSASESYLEVSADGIKVVGIDAALATKANVGDSYTKFESDAKYLTEHQDISNLATKEYVDVVKTDLNELSVKVYENSDNITIINGNESTDGSIAKALKDAKTYADTQVSAEKSRAEVAEKANADAIAIINGNEATDGSIKKSLADAKAYTDAQVSAETVRATAAENGLQGAIDVINGNEATDGSIAKALKDAKTYADEKSVELNTSISNAKAEAIEAASADATTKSDAALTSAKAYTDAEVATLSTSLYNSIASETVRATAAEKANADAIAIINGNEATDGSIKKSLADAKAYTDAQVSAEKSRAEVAEKANADAIAIINGNEATDGSIANALKDAKTYADTQVQNEATLRTNVDNELDAKIATKANINDVYTKAEIDAKNFVNQGDINGFATIEQVNAVDEKVNANITAIAEKANKADVYTKLESDDKFLTKVDAKETYATIAKLDETNVKVEQNKTDISTLNNTVENMKFDTVNTDTISLAMTSSTSGKTLSGDVKVAQVEGNIIKVNGSGIYANVSMEYDKATNTITFNNGNGAKVYELSMHSLVTDGYYDTETQKIVLVIETAKGTKHVYIPVADLVNDFKVENSDNNPIKLYKNVGSDGVNVLTASVAISTSPDNLVLNNNGTLFVSKEAKNHTAIIKGETVSVQKTLSDLDAGITTVNGDIANIQTNLTNITNDIDSLESKVNQNSLDIVTTKGQIETLSAQVSAMQEKVGLLEQSVNEYNAEIEKLKQVVGEPVEGELPIRERLDKIEEIVNSLIDFGQYQNTF